MLQISEINKRGKKEPSLKENAPSLEETALPLKEEPTRAAATINPAEQGVIDGLLYLAESAI